MMWSRFYYVVFHSKNSDGNWGIGHGSLHFFGAGWFNKFSLIHAIKVLEGNGHDSPVLTFWKEISEDEHHFIENSNNNTRRKKLDLLSGKDS
jgi:hypothetical protein